MNCVIRNCTKVAENRGLCLSCHKEAKGYVESGRVSWERLAHAGLAKLPDCETPFFSALKDRLPHVVKDRLTVSNPQELRDLIAGYGTIGCTLFEIMRRAPNLSSRQRVEMFDVLISNGEIKRMLSNSEVARFIVTE